MTHDMLLGLPIGAFIMWCTLVILAMLPDPLTRKKTKDKDMSFLSKLNQATPEDWDKANKVTGSIRDVEYPKEGGFVSLYPPSNYDLAKDIREAAAKSLVKSTGASTSYYELPEGAEELQDLIEHKAMRFSQANIFKAAYRLGNKKGNDDRYDLNKIVWFANRMLDELDEYEQEERKYEEDNGIY